uniref:Uncharacterized protein n=1 Tax=Anguilla anguilla TaxID=7936 RepID=A0A0E9P5K6_ANGAN
MLQFYPSKLCFCKPVIMDKNSNWMIHFPAGNSGLTNG